MPADSPTSASPAEDAGPRATEDWRSMSVTAIAAENASVAEYVKSLEDRLAACRRPASGPTPTPETWICSQCSHSHCWMGAFFTTCKRCGCTDFRPVPPSSSFAIEEGKAAPSEEGCQP